MFVESGFVYEQLQEIVSSGQVSDTAPIFSEFNQHLRSLGLDVLVSTYQVRSQLVAGAPSCISVYLRTTDNMVRHEIDPSLHNSGRGTHKHTLGIVEYWKTLIRKHGFPESHLADKVHVDFYSLEEIYLGFLPRICKSEVVQAMIASLLKDRGPKYVFCSSEPAFNIVFASAEDLSENRRRGYLDKVCDICDGLLADHDSFGYYRPGAVKVHFHHCDEQGLNLYGLSRED